MGLMKNKNSKKRKKNQSRYSWCLTLSLHVDMHIFLWRRKSSFLFFPQIAPWVPDFYSRVNLWNEQSESYQVKESCVCQEVKKNQDENDAAAVLYSCCPYAVAAVFPAEVREKDQILLLSSRISCALDSDSSPVRAPTWYGRAVYLFPCVYRPF